MSLSLSDFTNSTPSPVTPAPSGGASKPLSLSDFTNSTPKSSAPSLSKSSLSLSDFISPTSSTKASTDGATLAQKTPIVSSISRVPLSDPNAESSYLSSQGSSLTKRGSDLSTLSNTLVTSKTSLDKQGATYDQLQKNVTNLKSALDASESNINAYSSYNMVGQPMLDTHNAKVKAYNDAVSKLQDFSKTYKQSFDSYNAQVGDYSSKSANYNSDVDNYNVRGKWLKGSQSTPDSTKQDNTDSTVAFTDMMGNKISNDSFMGIVHNTITGLPKAAWDFLGPGQIQDFLATPEGQQAAMNLSGGDVVHGVVGAVGQFFGTVFADVVGIFAGPQTFNVPGVGEIKNIQQTTKEAVLNGTNPYQAIVQAAPQSIFDGLMVAGLAEKAFSPRESVIANGVKTNDLPGEASIPQTKSFRISKVPTVRSSTVPNEAIEALQKEQGVTFKKYDPALPSYFRTTVKTNGVMTGEIVQLKPSYFDVFKSKFGGDVTRVPDNAINIIMSADRSVRTLKDTIEKPPTTPSVPTEALMTQHLQNAANEVSKPISSTEITVPAVLDHTVRSAKIEAVKPLPLAETKVSEVATTPTVAETRNGIVKEWGTQNQYYLNNPYRTQLDKMAETGKFDTKVVQESSRWEMQQTLVDKPAYLNNGTLSSTEVQKFAKDNNLKVGFTNKNSPVIGKTKESVDKVIKLSNEGDKQRELGLALGYKDVSPKNVINKAVVGKKVKAIKTAKDFFNLPSDEQAKAFETLHDNIKQEIMGEMIGDSEHPTVKDILNGKQKIKIPQSIKAEVIHRLGGGNYRRIFRTSGNHSSLDEIATDSGFENDEALLEALGKGIESRKMALEGGFINPSKIAEDIKTITKKVDTYIKQTNENITFAKELDDTLYIAQKNNMADQIQNQQATKEVAKIPLTTVHNVGVYRDEVRAGLEPSITLSDTEKSISEAITAGYKDIFDKVTYMRKAGVPISFDANYDHRIVKDKGGPLDKIREQKDKLFPKGGIRGNKNVFKKSAPELKHQEMFNATNNKTGERMVIHNPGVKDGNITGFKDKEMTNLGPKKQTITPRTKEFFDKHVTPILQQVAKDLGIKHEVTALKGKKAGLSFTGQKKIQTHPGAPERVLIHEIGHQVDEKYGMQKMFEKDDLRNYGRDTMKDEMRAVADLKAGETASDTYKKYTRKGEEKIAQLFEAYLHVPEQFQEVAPNLYEKFDEFLRDHKELAPIRDIERSLELGMRKLGGQHVGGIKGNQFVATNGERYTLGQATRAEIQQHSNVEYYDNPLLAMLFAHDDITTAFRAVQLMEGLKSDPNFVDRTFKLSEGLKPEGYDTVDGLDQFRGIAFESSTARALKAYVNDIRTGDPNILIGTLSAINNFLINTMFMSPVIHPLRVLSSAFINRGFDNLNPLTYPRSVRAGIQSIISVATQDEDYIKILRSGVPTMSARIDKDKYRQNILDSLGEKSDPYKKLGRKAIQYAGNVTPFHWAHALTWPGNDMITHQQVREELAKAGLTVKTATPEQIFDIAMAKVFTVLPTYRLPVIARTVPGYMTKNILLFASYRYNLVRTFFELGHSLVTGNEPGNVHMNEKGQKTYFSKEQWKVRKDAAGKIIMMAILTFLITPFINEKLKKMTGNNNAYLTDLGEASVINNLNELISGKITLNQWRETIADFPPGTKEFIEQSFGLLGMDEFTGKGKDSGQ